jgi:hypothetical protein
MYGHLLGILAQNVGEGGPALKILRDDGAKLFSPGPLGIRLLAGLHELVLSGRAEGLAAYYPSAGGDWEAPGLRQALDGVLAAFSADLRAAVARPIQPNEVGRSAALLVGFHVVRRLSDLPLRLLELGACAGLNLLWDSFRYAGYNWSWGPRHSAVVLDSHYGAGTPVLSERVEVVDRLGCDIRPLRFDRTSDIIRIKSWMWADNAQRRFKQLDAACGIAAASNFSVQECSAGSWLAQQHLAAKGAATVVYHSIMREYLSPHEQVRISEMLNDAAERATADAPLAWLQLEPHGRGRIPTVHLRVSPYGFDAELAHSQFDGSGITFLQPALATNAR